MSMLAEKGRITLRPNVEVWTDHALAILPTKEAALNPTIARLSRQVPIPHQDLERVVVEDRSLFNEFSN